VTDAAYAVLVVDDEPEMRRLIRMSLSAEGFRVIEAESAGGIHFTPTEYRLLSALARRDGAVVTQRQLLREVWGPDHTDRTHYLRVSRWGAGGREFKSHRPDQINQTAACSSSSGNWRSAGTHRARGVQIFGR